MDQLCERDTEEAVVVAVYDFAEGSACATVAGRSPSTSPLPLVLPFAPRVGRLNDDVRDGRRLLVRELEEMALETSSTSAGSTFRPGTV